MSEEELTAFCPVYRRAVELVGRRWTGAILRAMLAGRTRFSEIEAEIPGLSSRLLSERLRELEEEGVVVRNVEPSVPVRITYELTDKGHDLLGVVESLAEWAERWMGADEPSPTGSR